MNTQHGLVPGHDGYEASGKFASDSVFHQQFLTRRIVLLASEAREFLPADHPAIIRLLSPVRCWPFAKLFTKPTYHLTIFFFHFHFFFLSFFRAQGSKEHSMGSVVFLGKRGLTHLTLARLLYKDDIPVWLAEEDASFYETNGGPRPGTQQGATLKVTVYSDGNDSDDDSEHSFATKLLDIRPKAHSFAMRNPVFDSGNRLRPTSLA